VNLLITLNFAATVQQPRRFLLGTAALICFGTPISHAQQVPEAQWPALKTDAALTPRSGIPGPIYTSGDRASGRVELELTLEGNAQLRREGMIVTADRITYIQPDEQVNAVGGVRLSKDGTVLLGNEMQLKLDTNQGYFANANYVIGAIGGRGFAKTLEIDGRSNLKATDAYYTTCGPDSPDWQLQGDSLELSRDEQQGRITGCRLVFMKRQLAAVPFFYFALGKQRQTGFLTPGFESNSRVGLGLVTPFYWNIAPNRDATIAPRVMTRRGIQFENEFRFLEPKAAAELRYDFNPRDLASNNFRYRAQVTASANLGDGWQLGVAARRVSDDNYLADYGRNSIVASETRLPAELTLTRSFGQWQFSARALTWQHLLEARQTPSYESIPQLRLSTEQTAVGFDWATTVDSTRFNIDRPAASAVGWRTYLNPSISYPISQPWYFFKPKLSVHASQYQLDRNPDGPNRLTRIVPTLSLDSGLVFERNLTWRSEKFTQTLEPRLFYVKTPYRDQSQFPVFGDTALADLNFASLLAENAFTGNDRIADANQLTTMLVSRILSPTDGAEKLRFAIGQRWSFSSQRVTLAPTDPPRTDTKSDILVSASGELTRAVGFDLGLQYSVPNKQVPRFNASLRYWPDDFHLVNFGYRYSKTTGVNQFDTSWRWKVDPRWSALGRLNYSFAKSGTATLSGATDRPGLVEVILGAEYDIDCWAFRAVVQKFVTADRKPTTQVFLQLELKGLGQVGNSPFEVLKRNIPGFKLPYDPLGSPSKFLGYE
jgi:LPS-assembly protein